MSPFLSKSPNAKFNATSAGGMQLTAVDVCSPIARLLLNFYFFIFFNLVYIFWLQIALSLCTLPQCTFTTHYVYCIFICICFIALSKRNQNRCPKQVGFCLCSASHWRRSMTELAKQTTPLALCCLRSVIKVSVSKAICSQKIYTRLKKKKINKKKKKPSGQKIGRHDRPRYSRSAL